MTPELVRFLCPQCGKRCKAPADAAGRRATCPRCGSRLEVPVPENPLRRGQPDATVSCPGCGRLIGLAADELALPSIQCTRCDIHFRPADHVAGQEPLPDQVQDGPQMEEPGQGRPAVSVSRPADTWELMGGGIVVPEMMPDGEPDPALTEPKSDENDPDKHAGGQFTRPKQQDLDRKTILIVSACAFAVLGGLFLVAYAAMRPRNTGRDAVGLMGLCMALVAVVLGCVIGHGLSKACPQCRRWWAKTPCGRELIDKKLACKTVTRTDWHSGGYSGRSGGGHTHHGTTWGTTARKEQVTVLRQTFRNYYGCEYCGHRWDEVTVEDSEDFELG
jgi:DNA-directed RNA polymerase subunit RPC12/RpoP